MNTVDDWQVLRRAAFAGARRKLASRQDAEDAAQMAVIRMARRADRRSPSLARWMGRLAGVDLARSNSLWLKSLDRAVEKARATSEAQDATTMLADSDIGMLLRAELPERYYRALLLLAAGYSAIETGRILGCCDRTVRNARYAAQRVLRKEIEP